MVVFKRRSSRLRVSSAAIALLTGLVPLTAAAQATPDRIDAIERHIYQLEGELNALKRELGATRQQLQRSRRETAQAREQAERAAGRNAIFLTGRLHFDIGDYLDYKPGSKFATVQNLNSGVNARRARLGVLGRFMRDWDYTFIFDFGGSSDGYPPTVGALASGLE